jgi:hypothetical protein
MYRRLSMLMLTSLFILGHTNNLAYAGNCEDTKGALRSEFSRMPDFVREWKKLSSEAKKPKTEEQQEALVREMDALLVPALKSMERTIVLLDSAINDGCYDADAKQTALKMKSDIQLQLDQAKRNRIPF